MFLIVGLGNPEVEYSKTRHNMGFNVINKLAEEYSIEVNKKKFKALYGTGEIEGEKVVLLKPQTYMNLSGQAVVEALNFYKIDLKNLILIYDDIDVAPSYIRIRKSGDPGSHKGMISVTELLGSKDFCRVRVGIGRPEHMNDMINYVIGAIPEEEVKLLDKGTDLARDAIIEMMKNGYDSAMNKFNKKKESKE